MLKKLIASADVMIENMAPGAIERLGFSYEVVQKINPKIIFAQIKGFASDGPYAKYLCFDTVAQTAGAGVSITGVEGEPPVRPGPNLGDTGGGLHCATGVLAALCQRQATGRGQRVQVAMQEAVINFSRAAFASHLALGKPPPRQSHRGIYRCKGDRPNDYCAIDTSEAGNERWHSLFRAIGKEELIDDPRFANHEKRAQHSNALDAELSAWCLQHEKTEAMDILQRAGVPAGAVYDTQELITDPHQRKSGMAVTIEHPVRGPVTIVGWPVKMSDSQVAVTSSPLLGVHTEEVLSQWVGLSKEEIKELRAPAPVAS
jgi:formyl-CoA transferase